MMASSLNLDHLMSVTSFEEQINFKARRIQETRSFTMNPGWTGSGAAMRRSFSHSTRSRRTKPRS